MSGKRGRDPQLPSSPYTSPAPPEPGEIAQIQAAFFSGPLPPPSLLAKYNDVIPNGAERIMAMAERQSAHRESLEAQVVAGNLEIQKQGTNRAFILALTIILGGIFLMYVGKDAYGFAAIITSIATLAGVFIYSKIEQRKERLDKAAILQSRRSQ